jgi:dihydrofolate reductase
MALNLIFARAANGVIGRSNALPWHLPEDLAHFKRCTLGSPVIMGRRTWDSIPDRFRPLPGRLNIVLTRQADWQAHGALRAAGLDEALALVPQGQDAWVIGGADLYAQALPRADRAIVTEIAENFEGDAFAPEFTPAWSEVSRQYHVAASGLRFSFVTYQQSKGI